MPALMSALAYFSQAMNLLPQLIGLGQSVMPLIHQVQTAASDMMAGNRGPTPEETAALRAATDSVHAAIQAVPDK